MSASGCWCGPERIRRPRISALDYRLIVSDLDGTLLNRDGRLLPSTVATLRTLAGAGVLIATASARTRSNTTAATRELDGLCCARACVNGAYIETARGRVLHRETIEPDAVDLILEQCRELDASVCCAAPDAATASIRHPECRHAFALIHGQVAAPAAAQDTCLMMVYAPSVTPLAELIQDRLAGLETSPVSSIARYGSEYLFVHPRGSHKGSALGHIADHFGVARSRTLAFGDALSNDGPLLAAAGTGVAMKNAGTRLRELADQVTDLDHDRDGVGAHLRRLFRLDVD